MYNTADTIRGLRAGAFRTALETLYPGDTLPYQQARYIGAVQSFAEKFDAHRSVRLFSAPGRTEVGGNHTDHQHGKVLAAAVNLDIICVAAENDDGVIRIQSKGHPQDDVDITDLTVRPSEKNKAASLIRGVTARCKERGHTVKGFDAYTASDVLKGSGLSSSAAFEVAVGTIISHLFNGGRIDPVEIAQTGQYAENVYFGKPSGLMDQMASSVGGFVTIDFRDTQNPVIEPVNCDFGAFGHRLCIVDTKGSHADLTGEYAAITAELRSVCALFGKEYLRDVDETAFYARLAEVRRQCGDRAALRAMHVFSDNVRVERQAGALRAGDFDAFKELIVESGRSSFTCLQNVFACGAPSQQGVPVGLALSERLLRGKGAWRVHGGGFAGTIQAFVPDDLLEPYRTHMEAVFGEGSCHVLNIRPVGGTPVLPD